MCNTFDFDIVKNIYTKNYLRIHNLHNILTKQINYDVEYLNKQLIYVQCYHNLCRRVIKYKERQFNFKNSFGYDVFKKETKNNILKYFDKLESNRLPLCDDNYSG